MTEPATADLKTRARGLWSAFGPSLAILLAAILWFRFPLSWFTWLFSAFLVIHGLVLYFRQYHRRKASAFFLLAGLSVTVPQISAGFEASSEGVQDDGSPPGWHVWVHNVGNFSPWGTLVLVLGGLGVLWLDDRKAQPPSQAPSDAAAPPVSKQTVGLHIGKTVNNFYYGGTSDLATPSSDTTPDPSAFADQLERVAAVQSEIRRLSDALVSAIRTDSVQSKLSVAIELSELLAAEDTNLPRSTAHDAYTLLARFWFEVARLESDPSKSENASQRSGEYSARARQFGEPT